MQERRSSVRFGCCALCLLLAVEPGSRISSAALPRPADSQFCPKHNAPPPLTRAHPQVDDEGNIVDSCFKTFGCGSAIASSSVATEWVKGKSLDDVTRIKNSDIAKHLSLPPVKLHCSMLAEDAIKAAVRDIKAKRAATATAGK